MNYVVIAILAAPGYLLAAAMAFVLQSQGRDREAVEAKLYTERDDALLQCEKLKKDYGELAATNADLTEQKAADHQEKQILKQRNSALNIALKDVQQANANYEVRVGELNSRIGILEDAALSAARAKRTTKKEVRE